MNEHAEMGVQASTPHEADGASEQLPVSVAQEDSLVVAAVADTSLSPANQPSAAEDAPAAPQIQADNRSSTADTTASPAAAGEAAAAAGPSRTAGAASVAPLSSNSSSVFQPAPVSTDQLEAVEAMLPSFAQRQQQQQLQGAVDAQELQQPDTQQQQQQYPALHNPMQHTAEAQQQQQQQPTPAPAALSEGEGAAAAATSSAGLATGLQPQDPASAAAASPDAATGTSPPALPAAAQSPAAQAAATPAAVAGAAAAPAAQAPPSAAAVQQAAVSMPVPDPLRDFVLTLDVRSFQAGRRLPVALGSIYVTAWLPKEFTGGPWPGGPGRGCLWESQGHVVHQGQLRGVGSRGFIWAGMRPKPVMV